MSGSMLEGHGLPGEGCIDLVAVMDLAAGAGHDGSVQIEVLFRLWADAGTSAAEDALVRSVGRLRAAAG